MGHIKNDKIRDGLGVFIWDDSKYVFGNNSKLLIQNNKKNDLLL
jgi:hypothetical protein